MTKCMFNNRTDARKTDVDLLTYIEEEETQTLYLKCSMKPSSFFITAVHL